jgi:hypothetical protein
MLNENNEIGFSGAQAIETKGHSNIGGDGNGRLGQSLGIGQPQTITMQ